MRKILWTILLVAAYVWIIGTGREDFVLEQGKALYKALSAWLEDATIETHLKSEKSSKKRSRRWD
jgi:hypothetical protein